jgi:hypothetical protein
MRHIERAKAEALAYLEARTPTLPRVEEDDSGKCKNKRSRRSRRDDKAKGQTAATVTATTDFCGMTNKRASNGNDEMRGSFAALRMTIVLGLINLGINQPWD